MTKDKKEILNFNDPVKKDVEVQIALCAVSKVFTNI